MKANSQPVDEGKKHEHQFTIPVEWKLSYLKESWAAASSNAVLGVFTPYDLSIVTKLRCTCGEEMER